MILHPHVEKSILVREYVKHCKCLRWVDLRGIDLSKVHLQRVDFTCADLRHADLSKAFLVSAKMVAVNMCNVDLSSAILTFADLSNSTLRGANLRGALVMSVNLNSACMLGADLRGANMNDSVMARSYLPDTDAFMLTPWGWAHVQRYAIRIGCQYFSTVTWDDFYDTEIDDMEGGALEWWKKFKPSIMALAEACEPYPDEQLSQMGRNAYGNYNQPDQRLTLVNGYFVPVPHSYCPKFHV